MANIEVVKENLRGLMATLPPGEKQKFLESLIDWLMSEYKSIASKEPSDVNKEEIKSNQYDHGY